MTRGPVQRQYRRTTFRVDRGWDSVCDLIYASVAAYQKWAYELSAAYATNSGVDAVDAEYNSLVTVPTAGPLAAAYKSLTSIPLDTTTNSLGENIWIAKMQTFTAAVTADIKAIS